MQKEKRSKTRKPLSISHKLDKKHNVRSGKRGKKKRKSYVQVRIGKNRPDFLNPMSNVNPLFILFKQGVFFTNDPILFIQKYYPDLRKLLADKINDDIWKEDSDPNLFVLWLLDELSKKIRMEKWMFTENGFLISESLYVDRGYGITVGKHYQIKSFDEDLYNYICMVYKIFVSKFNNLGWKEYSIEGTIELYRDMLDQNELEPEDFKLYKNTIDFYENKDPHEFAIDIMGSVGLTHELNKSIYNKLIKRKRNKEYKNLVEWLNKGALLMLDFNFRMTRSYYHEELSPYLIDEDSREMVSSIEFFPFIWATDDVVWEGSMEEFSVRCNEYPITPITYGVKISDYINNKKPDFSNLLVWFHEGANCYEYEEDNISKSYFADSKRTPVRK